RGGALNAVRAAEGARSRARGGPAVRPPLPNDVPVFVLCGGLGTRIREETELRPKPMVPIGNRPILWHIMRKYSRHGFKRFILCLGYKAEVIKAFFLHYSSLNSDFTVNLKSNEMSGHSVDHDQH